MADYFNVSDTPWYDSRDSIKSVVIGDGVKYIGKSTFNGFNALETVRFSDTVECIGETAFMDCTSLRSPTFPSSIKKICWQAFAGCDALDTLVLTGVTEIGVRAFEECSTGEFSYDIDEIARCKGLKSVSMPELTVLGERAFARCFNLEAVSMPKLTTVSSEGFSNCRMLKSIEMPSVTQIGDWAFQGNPTLEILEIGNIVSIGQQSFADNSNAMIFIPEGCTYQDDSFGNSTVAVEYTVNGGETPLNIIRPSSFAIHFPETVGGGKVVSANWEWYKSQKPRGKITHDGEHNPGEDRICKICGEHVHKWGEWQTDRTYHERSCEMLNQPGGCTYSDGYEYESHFNYYKDVYDKEATCTEDGNEWGQYCSKCGYVSFEPTTIPALGHDTENQEWKFDDKQHWLICGRCNDKVENADHAWDNGVTDGTTGDITYTCPVCQATKLSAMPPRRNTE